MGFVESHVSPGVHIDTGYSNLSLDFITEFLKDTSEQIVERSGIPYSRLFEKTSDNSEGFPVGENLLLGKSLPLIGEEV